MKGETIKVNGKIVRPDFQIIDKASGRIAAIYEAKTGSIYYLSGPGEKAYFKYEAARAQLGYKVQQVETVYQIKEKELRPGFRFRPGSGLKALGEVLNILGVASLALDIAKQEKEQEELQKKLRWLQQNDPDYYNQVMWEQCYAAGECV